MALGASTGWCLPSVHFARYPNWVAKWARWLHVHGAKGLLVLREKQGFSRKVAGGVHSHLLQAMSKIRGN